MNDFYIALTDEQDQQENTLFAALRAIQQLAFDADDLLDGLIEVGGGWRLWV